MKYFFTLLVLLGGLVGFSPASVQAATCPLTPGGAFKTSLSPAVYFITDHCTKQLLNHDQYFSYFTSWDDTHVVSASKLASVKTDSSPAVMGPHYFPRTGSIIKVANDPSVYYVVWFSKIKIASEDLFQAMGLQWSWVETVPQSTFDKFVTSPEGLNTTDDVFKKGIYLFRYSNNPEKIYFLLPDFTTGESLRHLLKNDVLIDYMGYRRDRIPTLPPFYDFKIGGDIDNLEEFFTQYLSESFGGMFNNFSLEDPTDNLNPLDDNDFFNNFDNFDTVTSTPSDIPYLEVDDNFDHILGNKNAGVTLIEYADFECPFCQRFHETLKEVVAKHPDTVRVVFRQYPLESIHEQSRNLALASECAGEQGKFWQFADVLFHRSSLDEAVDMSKLQSYAVTAGVDVSTFRTCYQSEKYAQKIDEDISDAQGAGAQGTPYTLLIDKKGNVVPLSGALPFSELESEIQKVL